MRPLFTLVILLTPACAPAPPPASSVSLTLGAPASNSDGSGFAPLHDGEDVTLVAGAQGGFHVWLKYHLDGAGPADAEGELSRTAHRLSDGALVLRTQNVVTLDPDPPAIRMFMCPSPIGLSILDVPIVYELALDPGGVHQSITLVPHCPVEQGDFCREICSG